MKKTVLVLLFVLLCAMVTFAESNDNNDDDLIATLYDDSNSDSVYADVSVTANVTDDDSDIVAEVEVESELLDRLNKERNELSKERRDAMRNTASIRDLNLNQRIIQINSIIAQKEAALTQMQATLIARINDSNLSAEKKQELIDSINARVEERISDLNEQASEMIEKINERLDKMETMSEIKDYRETLREAFVEAAKDKNMALKEEVRAARVAIARIISEAIKNNPDLNFSDVIGLGQEIRIEAGQIIADSNTRIQAKRLIRLMVRDHVLEIRNDSNSVEIEDENATAEVEGELSIDDNGLHMMDRNIHILPSAVKNKIKHLEKMKLRIENNIAHYETEVENVRNLLGFIPMSVKEKIKINAENGAVISYDKPWWSVIATGNDAVSSETVVE